MSLNRSSLRLVLAALVLISFSALASPAAARAATTPQTRTVVDMAGRHVTIPADVTKVATNIPLVPPTVAALGGVKKLVNLTSSPSTSLFQTMYPSTRSLPAFPVAGISPEEVLKLHGQVLIMTSLTPTLLTSFSNAGIPVVEIGNFTDAKDLETAVKVMAEVLGGNAPARAKAFDSFYSSRVSAIQSKTKGVSRPTVYYAPGPDTTTTVGTGNIITTSINQAGGVNVAAQHGIGASTPGSFAFPSISAETLLSWNPQIIVTITPQVKQLFLTDPQLSALSAVRNHRVYACPSGAFAWCASSAEAALQPLWLASVLHPKQFKATGQSLSGDLRTFYSRFYSYKLSSKQVQTILDS